MNSCRGRAYTGIYGSAAALLPRAPKRQNRGMDLRYVKVAGGNPLDGEIKIQGSKNAVLPVLTSCILGKGICRIGNCPRISDVDVTLRLLKAVGCKVSRSQNTVTVDASEIKCCEIPPGDAVCIRSSILFLGAMIGRCKKTRLPFPGGCAIGERPIDLHIRALKRLGVCFTDMGELYADGSMLQGGEINLGFPSVGATENIVLAAVLAPGKTVIRNAALEPEIDELCEFLNMRGAKICRMSDGSIQIEGVKELGPVSYTMRADRIVAGTYMFAAAIAGGKIRIMNLSCKDLMYPILILSQMGAEIEAVEDGCIMSIRERIRAVPYLETAPYPGFPTDLQSPLLASLVNADGPSCIRETIFENRFRIAGELEKMGAEIEIRDDRVYIKGRNRLHGMTVCATDLRSGAALVIAALGADGETRVSGIEYIERGYEDICRDLRLLGADAVLVEE